MKSIILAIDGMTCSACSNGLEKYLNKQNGIFEANVNLVMANATITYDEQILNQEKIEKYIKNWEKYYSEKNIEGVTTEFNKIKKQFKNIIPLENIINEVRKIDNINQLIENSNEFNFDELYLNIAEKI